MKVGRASFACRARSLGSVGRAAVRRSRDGKALADAETLSIGILTYSGRRVCGDRSR